MTHRLLPFAARHALALASLLVAACANPPSAPPDPSVTSASPAPLRLAQLGHGRNAAFGHCRADTCPQRRPKTLPPPPPPATTHAAAVPHAPADPEARNGGAILSSPLQATKPPETNPPVQRLDIQFPFASARLDTGAREVLHGLAPRLVHARQISVSGRTDNTGSVQANERLAQARADAVLHALVALSPGIASVATVDAQGACCYAESNDNPAGRARNRRVEIRYVLGPDRRP